MSINDKEIAMIIAKNTITYGLTSAGSPDELMSPRNETTDTNPTRN